MEVSYILQLKTQLKKIMLDSFIIYVQTANQCKVSNQFDSLIFGHFNLHVTSWENPLKLHVGHDLYDNLLESDKSTR